MFIDEVIATLKTMPKDDPQIPRPSVKAINRIKKLLIDVEVNKFPFPDVYASEHGIKLVWKSNSREIKLNIGQTGDMTFATAVKQFDRFGEVTNIINGEGHLEMPNVGHVMAWFLMEQAAEA